MNSLNWPKLKHRITAHLIKFRAQRCVRQWPDAGGQHRRLRGRAERKQVVLARLTNYRLRGSCSDEVDSSQQRLGNGRGRVFKVEEVITIRSCHYLIVMAELRGVVLIKPEATAQPRCQGRRQNCLPLSVSFHYIIAAIAAGRSGQILPHPAPGAAPQWLRLWSLRRAGYRRRWCAGAARHRWLAAAQTSPARGSG